MTFFSRIKSVPEKIIFCLEDTGIPFYNYLITFFCIVSFRTFAEAYSQVINNFNQTSSDFIINAQHYFLCYTLLAILIIYVFHFAAKISVDKACRVVLPSFIILLLTPLLDLIITGGSGVNILYFIPGSGLNFYYAYLTIGGNFSGISLGMRIEIFIALLAIFTYFRIKKLGIISSVFFTLICYSLIFLTAASLFFLKWLIEWSGLDYEFSSMLMIHFYLIAVFILGMGLFYLQNKKFFITLCDATSIQGLFHYELLFLLGAAIALSKTAFSFSETLFIYQDLLINLVLCLISIFFLFLTLAAYKLGKFQLTLSLLILSLYYAFIADPKALFIISIIMASFYIYAELPFKLNRLIVISKLPFALNALALVVLGYLIVKQNVYGFPNILAWIFFTSYLIAANLLDVNVAGLSNLIGIKSARIITGLALWETYLVTYYLIQNVYFLVVSFVVGGLQFLLIIKNSVKEQWLLGISNIYLLMLILYLLITACMGPQ